MSTQKSPFYLLYGRDPCLPADEVLAAQMTDEWLMCMTTYSVIVLLKPGSWLKVKFKNPESLKKSVMIGKLLGRRYVSVIMCFCIRLLKRWGNLTSWLARTKALTGCSSCLTMV